MKDKNSGLLERDLEAVIKQEIAVEGKIKEYLYQKDSVKEPFKGLVLDMLEIQNKKRQIHKKLFDIQNAGH